MAAEIYGESRLTRMRRSYELTYTTLRWVWVELISPYSRKRAVQAALIMLTAMFVVMSVTYILKDIVNAIASNDRERAMMLLIFGVGAILLVYQLLHAFHNTIRELSWNSNYKNLFVGFSRLFFRRTMGELIAETSEVGAEQMESAKDRVTNIIYMVLFEFTQVLATIMTSTMLMAAIDWKVSIVMLFIILFNIGWFLHFNTIIDEKMDEIDAGFRKHYKRTVDKWRLAASIKANGAEEKMIGEIEAEIEYPLAEDKKVWAYWFQWNVDVPRTFLNITAIIGVLLYGIHTGWSAGDFAAMFTWTMLILEKFGFIGHMMRHLTHQVTRIKAVREALTQPPKFLYDTGIVYQRKEQ